MKSIIEAFGSSNFEDTKVAIRNSKNSLCGKIAVKKLRKVWEKIEKIYHSLVLNEVHRYGDQQTGLHI